MHEGHRVAGSSALKRTVGSPMPQLLAEELGGGPLVVPASEETCSDGPTQHAEAPEQPVCRAAQQRPAGRERCATGVTPLEIGHVEQIDRISRALPAAGALQTPAQRPAKHHESLAWCRSLEGVSRGLLGFACQSAPCDRSRAE